MRTLFEEGFGVLGGALGANAGMLAGMGVIAILGLGPFGAFVAVFVCASAGGILGMELFKKGGTAIYDIGAKIDNGQIYHSPDQLLEIVK